MTKRSVMIAGHRTSVSLEQPFWEALNRLARRRGQSIPSLIAEIDVARAELGGAESLSSAIRVHLLEAAQAGELAPPAP